MNSRTKNALIGLVKAQANATARCIHMTGVDTVKELFVATEILLAALEADETITETA